jgi:hypothetical protein
MDPPVHSQAAFRHSRHRADSCSFSPLLRSSRLHCCPLNTHPIAYCILSPAHHIRCSSHRANPCFPYSALHLFRTEHSHEVTWVNPSYVTGGRDALPNFVCLILKFRVLLCHSHSLLFLTYSLVVLNGIDIGLYESTRNCARHQSRAPKGKDRVVDKCLFMVIQPG